jgi:hypothetical protein
MLRSKTGHISTLACSWKLFEIEILSSARKAQMIGRELEKEPLVKHKFCL